MTEWLSSLTGVSESQNSIFSPRASIKSSIKTVSIILFWAFTPSTSGGSISQSSLKSGVFGFLFLFFNVSFTFDRERKRERMREHKWERVREREREIQSKAGYRL